MKRLIHFVIGTGCFIILSLQKSFSQNVGIGTTAPNASAILDITSNTKGLLIPRLNSIQRNAIVLPGKGLLTYDSSRNGFWFYDGKGWKELSGNSFNGDGTLVVGQQTGTAPSYNMSPSNYGASDSSGFLYDSGGPGGNYGNNENLSFQIDNSNAFAIDINVMSLNLESPYDSLVITDAYSNRHVLTGTTTGKFRCYSLVDINFHSNSVNTQAGFTIRWNKIFTGNNNYYDSTQTTGWFFNPAKLSMRGGLNTNNNWSPDSSGRFSFSYGDDAQAKGTYAISMGNETQASGYESVSIGNFNIATGNNSLALGSYSKASATNAIAMGFNADATSYYSTAIGTYTLASGYQSTAMGAYTTAIGTSSTSIGAGNLSIGYESTAMGTNTTAAGSFSVSIGLGVKTKSYAGLATGLYNDTTSAANPINLSSTNRIFEIGNGTADNARSNAVTVLQNGNIGIGELSPAVPLNFASTAGNKISLWGNGVNHYGFGTQAALLQVYTESSGSDIAFGYGNSSSFNETMRIKGTGDGIIKGNLTVQNGKGLIRSSDGTQQKKITKDVLVNVSLSSGASTSISFTFPESFSAAPDTYIGNVISGAGGWAEVIMSLANVTPTGGSLYVHNPRNVTWNPNFTVRIIAIGPQ